MYRLAAEESTNEVEYLAMYRPQGGSRENKSKQAPDRSRSETHRLGIFGSIKQTKKKLKKKKKRVIADEVGWMMEE